MTKLSGRVGSFTRIGHKPFSPSAKVTACARKFHCDWLASNFNVSQALFLCVQQEKFLKEIGRGHPFCSPSPAATPIERTFLLVRYRQNSDFIWTNRIKNRIREFVKNLSPDPASQHLRCCWKLNNAFDGTFNCVDENAAKTSAFHFIKVDSFVDFDFS
jgi:hypothetical protein